MINPYKLEIFAQVVAAGSFSRAAQNLLMTQSAVSQHMQELEASLGTQLFVRGPRGVTLTDAGETLYSYAAQIFALLAEAENAVADVSRLGESEVHVGATPGVSVYLMPDCIILFRSRVENVAVTVHTGTSAETLSLSSGGQVDFAIIEGEVVEQELAHLEIEPLYEFEQMVIIGREHEWWGRRHVAIAELNNREFIMRQSNSQTRIWLDASLVKHGVTPRVNTVFDNIDSIKRGIARGTSLTILPRYVVQAELMQGVLQALPIEGQPLRRTLKLVRAHSRPLPPAANAFLLHMKSCLEENYG